jgi:hypothetical protein
MHVHLPWRGVSAAALLLILVAALMPSAAFAHERRAVGKYALVVGFNGEPAYQGQPNAAQVTVTVPSEDNRPVEGLADTLKTTVAFGGGQPKEFKLRSVFGTPGRYVADFIPTRAGTYIFNFTGTIEGNPINERFESGPGRFDDVQSVEAIQFPETVPAGNDVARNVRDLDDRVAAAESEAQSARNLATVGLGIGVLGVVIAVIAVSMLLARRRPAGALSRAN